MGKKSTNWLWAVVLIVVVLVLSGTIEIGGLLQFGGVGTDLVDVNKQIKFHFVDKYAGGPIASKTNTFNLYASDGQTILEADLDTDANGHCTTSSDYASGSTLYMRYESSNDKQWWKVVVPKMSKADAESATYNLIRLESFTIGTYTSSYLHCSNGTAIADSGTYDISIDGNTETFTYYIVNTGSDNTGLMTSYDPLYAQNWHVEFFVTFSGTDYEKIVVYDFDYDFTLGTTHYVGETCDAYALTKHKVANTYKSEGKESHSFYLDMSGCGGSASVTMQLSVRAYADHVYAQNHGGSFGPEAYELDEITVTISA